MYEFKNAAVLATALVVLVTLAVKLARPVVVAATPAADAPKERPTVGPAAAPPKAVKPKPNAVRLISATVSLEFKESLKIGATKSKVTLEKAFELSL